MNTEDRLRRSIGNQVGPVSNVRDAAKQVTATGLTNELGKTTLRIEPGIDIRGGSAIQLLLGQ